MVLLGGTTRLTGSGLSIVDWRPVTGIVPPLSTADWEMEFQKYQTSPEFQKKNFQLTLAGFQKIYFWEYFHRVWGRLLGFFLVLPALWFWRRLEPWLKKRLVFIFCLLALQGFMGWFMVKSGLLDRPEVSHFRLAVHFFLALWLLSILRWTEWELASKRKGFWKSFRLPTAVLGFLLLMQLAYGAFLAGTKAGWTFSTFPSMNGQWFPDGALALQPFFANFVENGIFIHWWHRVLGTIFLVAVGIAMVKRGAGFSRLLLLSLVFLQYVLGITAVVFHIPVSLGVAHQFVAVLVTMALLKVVFEDGTAQSGI